MENLIINQILECADEIYIDEKSHSSLKVCYRKAFDINTGHQVAVVYELDPSKITNVGGGGVQTHIGKKPKDPNSKEYKEWEKKRKDFVENEVKPNIKKRGYVDFSSKNMKVLGIKDRVTGKSLKSADLIGIYAAPGWGPTEMEPGYDKDQFDYLHNKLKTDPDIAKRVHHVVQGKIDPNESFKSTHLFNDTEYIKDEETGKMVPETDNSIGKMAAAETIGFGRGAKLNDITNTVAMPGEDYPVYAHPSKKDKKQHPELYKKESVELFYEYALLTEAEAAVADMKPVSDNPIRDALEDMRMNAGVAKQKIKHGAQNVQQVGASAKKSFDDCKNWLQKIINSARTKKYNDMKEEITDPKSRKTFFKGLTNVLIGGSLFKVNWLLGMLFLVLKIIGMFNKNAQMDKIRNEVIFEIKEEIKILDTKIEEIGYGASDQEKAQKYKMMRVRNELKKKLFRATGNKLQKVI